MCCVNCKAGQPALAARALAQITITTTHPYEWIEKEQLLQQLQCDLSVGQPNTTTAFIDSLCSIGSSTIRSLSCNKQGVTGINMITSFPALAFVSLV